MKQRFPKLSWSSRSSETELTTAELARRFRVKPESIRHALCIRGHYCGLKPRRLPNGRLLWPGQGD